jgi:hypothetical protein
MLSKLLRAAVCAIAIVVAPTVVLADDFARNEFYRSLAGNSASVADEPEVLLISGVIGPGSYDELRSALTHSSPKLVILDGPGGILGEALMMGDEIRRRNLDTLVGPNRSCASACAVVFLSGRVKYLASGAAVGLHAASFADGRADPEATEVMAAYLRGVGVPNATLKRMARTAPSDIRWLSKAEIRALKIKSFAQ